MVKLKVIVWLQQENGGRRWREQGWQLQPVGLSVSV
jgi:hypothetical protein